MEKIRRGEWEGGLERNQRNHEAKNCGKLERRSEGLDLEAQRMQYRGPGLLL